jgi:hypothetical protein
LINDNETILYNSFIQTLINKVKSDKVDIADLKLIKEFIQDRNIGANPQTHKPTKELNNAMLPFDDSEDNITPIRVKKVK